MKPGLTALAGARAPGPETDDRPRAVVYPLIDDTGLSQAVCDFLETDDWFDLVETEDRLDPMETDYRLDPMETDDPLADTEFDLCLVDETGLRNNHGAVAAARARAAPVALPVLLLQAPARIGDSDVGRPDSQQAASAAGPSGDPADCVDDIVSLPLHLPELRWRLATQLRHREQSRAIHRSRSRLELFERAVEASGHAVYITDSTGTIEYVNPAFEEITGYDARDAIGATPAILSSGEMSDAYYDELWETLEAGEQWTDREIVNRRASGECYTAIQTIAPVTANGEVVAFVAVQTDVTERTEREQQLRVRTRALDESPIGIVITDPRRPDNPIVYVNRAFESLTGYDREDALGRNCRFLQGPGTDPDRVATVRSAIEARQPVSVELRNYRQDGTEFWNRLDIAPVHGEDGRLLNFVGFQQDVTDRKHRERQLNVIDRVLRHNVRNEMNVILGRAELLARDPSDAATSDHATRIAETARTLVETVEKEREITELLTHHPTWIDTDLARDLRRLVDHLVERHPAAHLTLECPDSLTVRTTVEFARAIEELVTNAIVHHDSTPAVTVRVHADGERVTVTIADTGPEIPESERQVLRGTWEETPLEHGTGLGLWLVTLVLSRASGSVSYETNDPRGNVFHIEIPIEPSSR